jgi:hypothetical protein
MHARALWERSKIKLVPIQFNSKEKEREMESWRVRVFLPLMMHASMTKSGKKDQHGLRSLDLLFFIM